MNTYLHRVLGFYATLPAAQAVRDQLVQRGMAPQEVTILQPGHGAGGAAGRADSDDVLLEVLKSGAIGTAAGTVAGGAGTVALALANVSLFVASPVLGALVMLGWGASLGGLIGALAGVETKKGDVSDLVKDALAAGHVVLVAYTSTEMQTTLAQKIVSASMAEAGSSTSSAKPALLPVAS